VLELVASSFDSSSVMPSQAAPKSRKADNANFGSRSAVELASPSSSVPHQAAPKSRKADDANFGSRFAVEIASPSS